MIENANNILVDFNMIVNTDVGVFSILKERYHNPKIIDPIILDTDIDTLLYRLKDERYNNVIELFVNEGYNTGMVYSQLISTKYKEILDKSMLTEVLNVVNVYIMTNVITVTILCKNKLEEQVIKKINSKFNVLLKTREKVNVKDFDSIFIKDYRNVIYFENLKCKNIFISNYKNNIDEKKNLPLVDISAIIGKTNNIYTMDLHNVNNPLG